MDYNHTISYLSIVCKLGLKILKLIWFKKKNSSKDFGANMIKITSESSVKNSGVNLELIETH